MENKGQWRRDEWRDELSGEVIAVEVVPINDLQLHISSEHCPCIPDYQKNQFPPRLIHASFDGRESGEVDLRNRGN